MSAGMDIPLKFYMVKLKELYEQKESYITAILLQMWSELIHYFNNRKLCPGNNVNSTGGVK